ncbi:MAG: AAA family ATPase [Actinomycetota bacterium]
MQGEDFVGRAEELDALKGFLADDAQVLAVHGIGGVGKSALVGRFKDLAETTGVRVSMRNAPNGTIGVPRFLKEVSGDLGEGHVAFDRLNAELDEYLRRESVLEGGGGAAGLLGAIGLVKEPTGLSAAASRLGQTLGARSRDRLAADSYWRGAPASLAEAFGEGCDGLMLGRPSVVVIDRWEYASDFDVFACETLVPRLPRSVKVIVAGRKDLAISNPRWLSGRIGLHPGVHVDEFAPEDAREFLRRAGLEEASRQNEVLAVVGGFPLLLVLLRTLARGPGGWDAVGPLQPRDNNQLARLLLERILDAPGGEELGPALELGCIPDHLTPALVGVVLEVEEPEAARIYDLLDDSELTEPHPSGIRIHDRVRELLLDRLKFNRPDAFQAVSARVVDHYRRQVPRP